MNLSEAIMTKKFPNFLLKKYTKGKKTKITMFNKHLFKPLNVIKLHFPTDLV